MQLWNEWDLPQPPSLNPRGFLLTDNITILSRKTLQVLLVAPWGHTLVAQRRVLVCPMQPGSSPQWLWWKITAWPFSPTSGDYHLGRGLKTRQKEPAKPSGQAHQPLVITTAFWVIPSLTCTLLSFSSGFWKWWLFQKKSINVSVHKIWERSNKGILVLKAINFVQHAFELQLLNSIKLKWYI